MGNPMDLAAPSTRLLTKWSCQGVYLWSGCVVCRCIDDRVKIKNLERHVYHSSMHSPSNTLTIAKPYTRAKRPSAIFTHAFLIITNRIWQV
jgi:hypothetical protein